jgi:peptidylprolyl isomerase
MDTRKLGRGKAHVWNVGDGTVIAGIDIAVRGMKPGGIREVVLPPELHWGNSGYGGVIPKDARLKFVIEMVSVR